MSEKNSRDSVSESSSKRVQVAQRHYEPHGASELTTSIVYAIADAEGVQPTELKSPPLYEAIDAPALEEMFFGKEIASGSRKSVGSVEFQYRDYLVTVTSDGWIQVYESSEPERP